MRRLPPSPFGTTPTMQGSSRMIGAIRPATVENVRQLDREVIGPCVRDLRRLKLVFELCRPTGPHSLFPISSLVFITLSKIKRSSAPFPCLLCCFLGENPLPSIEELISL